VSESNEANNRVVASVPIQVFAPDLVMGRVTAPSTGGAGRDGSGFMGRDQSWGRPHHGAVDGPTVAVEGRRVQDGCVGNWALGKVPQDPLAAGQGYERTANVLLPLNAAFPPGSYFLLVETDGAARQPESDEANNLASIPITLTLPPVA
jgi:hypothetical protein